MKGVKMTGSLKHHRKLPSSKSGFTLIELLVSVAVIALLIAILVPTLSAVRARGKSTKCAGSLHAVGQALGAYTTEYSGYIPTDFQNLQNWSSSTYYGKTVATLACPMTMDGSDPNYNYGTSYGFYGGGATKINLILSSSTDALAMDAAMFEQNNGGIGKYYLIMNTSYTVPLPWTSASSNLVVNFNSFPSSTNADTSPLFYGRHSGAGNVAWYDGHVSTETPYVPDIWKAAFKKYNIGGLTPIPKTMTSTDFLNQSPLLLNRYFLAR